MIDYHTYLRALGYHLPSLVRPPVTIAGTSKHQGSKKQYDPVKAKRRRKIAKASRRINRGKSRKT